ncbi:MAG TPA: ABC transporter ATP-binding protein [Smithellaceae bacterium]|jgi:ABC-2 type transport system ATP-binding protein|nr:ABC transporter ATP-binding protein [Smithellaceae bacterium]
MQDSPSPMVEVKKVFLRFKQVEALRDVSFDVERQTIFGLVGSDGAGKSSMLRLIAGMLKPSLGTIRINGLDVTEQHGKIKQLIGYMPQRFGLYPDLTVDENMAFFMDVFGIARAERKKRREKYLGFSNLLPFANRPAGNLSGGMKQKLGLACVLVHEPRLLILDEPTNGVDPVSRHEFWDILNNMKQEGMTMIISTAYLDEGEMCDSLGVMHQSVLLASAPPDVISGGQNSLEEAIILQIEQKNGDLAHDTFQL